jgi:hypothetical protein
VVIEKEKLGYFVRIKAIAVMTRQLITGTDH